MTRALPELLGTARVDSCDVTEKWTTVFRGLASYTLPKIGVLVSASMRSLEATPGGGVATSGLSLAANYVVPNTVIAESLGRLPANALATGTTTVNLLNPGQLYSLERTNLVDMRFAKILQVRGQPHRRRYRPLQPVQLERHDCLSTDVRVPDQRRRVAYTDGHRCAPPRALQCHVQLLGIDRAGPREAQPAPPPHGIWEALRRNGAATGQPRTRLHARYPPTPSECGQLAVVPA